MSSLNLPFKRIGGKVNLSPWIADLITPFSWGTYIEPFAGSAAVYFRLCQLGAFSGRLHARAVLNDSDQRIVNLFRSIQEEPELLSVLIDVTPFSRWGHGEAKTFEPDLETLEGQLEDARQYLISNQQSFSGCIDGGWSYTTGQTSRESLKSWVKLSQKILDTSKWLNPPGAMGALRHCYIENLDAIECVKLWDSPHTCIYADPPYIGLEDYYEVNQDLTENEELHLRLARALNSAVAPVIAVSYYDHPQLDLLYPPDTWQRHYKDVPAHSTRTKSGATRDRRQELLLLKSPDKPATQQLTLFG